MAAKFGMTRCRSPEFHRGCGAGNVPRPPLERFDTTNPDLIEEFRAGGFASPRREDTWPSIEERR